MTTTTAFLDSNVIFGSRLSNVLLWVAHSDLYEPLWSERVLAAVVRDVPRRRRNVTPERITKRVDQMRRAFPAAMIDGFEPLEPEMGNHPGDRHVLAAAVHGHADVLVTSNLKHFPKRVMDHHGIVAIHPDDFLLKLLEVHGPAMENAVAKAILSRGRPPESFPGYLDRLAADVPRFAAEMKPRLEVVDPSAGLRRAMGFGVTGEVSFGLIGESLKES
ncbi:PIN domain-containing protein [Amycolatopsis sp. NPDC051903]|uniref:PIN domain-containing protein n=1 Tax=Amycolatopsis sp. NPDC051903 TaxID=3363936 RepID=UPI0037A0DC64